MLKISDKSHTQTVLAAGRQSIDYSNALLQVVHRTSKYATFSIKQDITIYNNLTKLNMFYLIINYFFS